MTDLISREAAISELTLRRSLLDAQNVVTNVCRDLSIYDICIDALRALPAQAPAVKVKPLVWHGPDCIGEYYAYSIFETYCIVKARGRGYWVSVVGAIFQEIGEAKAAAQSHYAARILAAIEPAQGGEA